MTGPNPNDSSSPLPFQSRTGPNPVARRSVGKTDAKTIEDIQTILKGVDRIVAKGRDAFLSDLELRDAAAYKVIGIQSAIDKAPTGFADRFPDVPYRNIKRTRDMLSHHYSNVDAEPLWLILVDHLPKLRDALAL